MSRSRQKTGSNLDNEISKGIIRNTPEHVVAHPIRGSGNVIGNQPDVLIRDTKTGRDRSENNDGSQKGSADACHRQQDYAIELKRMSADVGEKKYVNDFEEEVAQLMGCAVGDTNVYVGLLVTGRELCLVRLRDPNGSVDRVCRDILYGIPDAFEPSLTDGGNLRITKPKPPSKGGEWPSATAGRDPYEVVIDELGLPRGDGV